MHVVCVCAMCGVCVVNGSSIAASLPVRLPYCCVRPAPGPCPSLCSPGSPGSVPCTWLVQEPPQPRKRPGTHDLPHRQRSAVPIPAPGDRPARHKGPRAPA
eukprot:scaffold20755_cov136-Isochrysis_galbana.AAC.4